MRLKLTWNTTCDELLFDVVSKDLTAWFVEQSNLIGQNRYTLGDQVIDGILKPCDTSVLIEQEIAYIHTVNGILEKLKLPRFDLPTDWFDQAQLNRLHKDWAETRFKHPRLTELLYKLDEKYYEAYQEMNCHIHLIERSFQYRFRDNTHWRVPNPFQNQIQQWQVCHLYIEYPGHGRNAYEQFQWMDDGVDAFRDSVNWDNIDAFLGMNLVKPYKVDPPTEFLEWCEKQNLVPHGYTQPIANLVEWQKQLPLAKNIITKNVAIKDNYFSLAII